MTTTPSNSKRVQVVITFECDEDTPDDLIGCMVSNAAVQIEDPVDEEGDKLRAYSTWSVETDWHPVAAL